MLIAKVCTEVRRSHPVATVRSRSMPARPPGNSTGHITATTSVVFGIASTITPSASYYAEGEDTGPKRYGTRHLGPLVASQPDQIAYIIIFDSTVVTSFIHCRRCPADRRARANSPANSSSIRRRWKRPSQSLSSTTPVASQARSITTSWTTAAPRHRPRRRIGLAAIETRAALSRLSRCGPASTFTYLARHTVAKACAQC